MLLSPKTAVLGLVAATAAATLGAAPATAGPATNVGRWPGVEARCDSSPYLLCLYYGAPSDSAWWGTGGPVGDLGRPPQYFTGPGEGAGRPVRGNAASISCDASTTSICYVYDRSGFAGDVDRLHGQRTGDLAGTYKNNVSVRISLGA